MKRSDLHEVSPHSANYDFGDQFDPARPMGQGSFANMPEKEIMQNYNPAEAFRDGITNSFTNTLRKVSRISENQK